jgi:hypothetical protein
VSIAKTLNLLFIYYCIQQFANEKVSQIAYLRSRYRVKSKKDIRKSITRLTDRRLDRDEFHSVDTPLNAIEQIVESQLKVHDQAQNQEKNLMEDKTRFLDVLNWYIKTFRICSSENKTLQRGQDPRYFMDSNTVCKYFYSILADDSEQHFNKSIDLEYSNYVLTYTGTTKNVGHWANLYKYAKQVLSELLPYWKSLNINELDIQSKLTCNIIQNFKSIFSENFFEFTVDTLHLIGVNLFQGSATRYIQNKICDLHIKLLINDPYLSSRNLYKLTKGGWDNLYSEYFGRAGGLICVHENKIFGGTFLEPNSMKGLLEKKEDDVEHNNILRTLSVKFIKKLIQICIENDDISSIIMIDEETDTLQTMYTKIFENAVSNNAQLQECINYIKQFIFVLFILTSDPFYKFWPINKLLTSESYILEDNIYAIVIRPMNGEEEVPFPPIFKTKINEYLERESHIDIDKEYISKIMESPLGICINFDSKNAISIKLAEIVCNVSQGLTISMGYIAEITYVSDFMNETAKFLCEDIIFWNNISKFEDDVKKEFVENLPNCKLENFLKDIASCMASNEDKFIVKITNNSMPSNNEEKSDSLSYSRQDALLLPSVEPSVEPALASVEQSLDTVRKNSHAHDKHYQEQPLLSPQSTLMSNSR